VGWSLTQGGICKSTWGALFFHLYCCCLVLFFLFALQEAGMLKETWMEEDPREAILRYDGSGREGSPNHCAGVLKVAAQAVVLRVGRGKEEELGVVLTRGCKSIVS